MLSPIICRRSRDRDQDPRRKQRGVTIALVAVAMVGIVSMAALSIDIGTFYEARAEAQRAADAGALTAARVISLSGITGDPSNLSSSWQPTCGGGGSTATIAATAVAQVQQNFVGGTSASVVTVKYGLGSVADCVSLAGSSFGVNPIVSVNVQRINLPIFFGRVFSLVGGTYSGASVSATATAEAFNPSGSGLLSSGMVPVQPRCVKPWIVPNIDPIRAPVPFVNTNGTLVTGGVYPTGVIGEPFSINAACNPAIPGSCSLVGNNPPSYVPPVLQYVPALVSGNAGAVPSCAPAAGYQATIAGCDQTTVYACGTPSGAYVDLTENPVNPPTSGDTATAVACLTQSTPAYNGADTLTTVYPYQIQAGAGNPLVTQGVVPSGDFITTSNSIVTIPIYDNSSGAMLVPPQPQVTVIGFLQLFINGVDAATGNINVTVMNVAGCGNAVPSGVQSVSGTSPVPVRLITPP